MRKFNPTATTVSPTKTGAAFAVIPQMTATFTGQLRDVMVEFSGAFNVQDDDEFDVAIFLDGVQIAASTRHIEFHASTGLLGLTPGSIDGTTAQTMALILALSAVPHTIDVRWSETGPGGSTARAIGTQRQLIIREIP